MSAMETILTGPLVQAIGWALLHLLWQGVLVAAILAAALALLQRQSANARYLASCGALLLLVALSVATGYRAYAPDIHIVDAPGIALAVPADAEPTAAPAPLVSAEVVSSDAIAPMVSFANTHLVQIVAIWLAGVLILSTRLIIGWIGAHRLTTRRSHAASDQWKRSLRRIADALALSRPITLLESAAVEVPTVIGWLRPVVLLPMASLSGLSIQQIEMVLAHELAHIRRHDFIVNLMQSVVETLLFYHPAVWWISRRIRVEREHCCDDLAVAVFGDPVQYARALTRFEELRLDAQSVVAANGGSLISRIRRLVIARAESASWTSRWAAGVALLTVVAAILLAPALPLFANRDEQTPPAAAPAPKAPSEKSEKTKDSKDCDTRARTPRASVDVQASIDDDPESDDDNSDDEIATPPVPAPAPMPLLTPYPTPVAVPHIAPMVRVNVDRMVDVAMEASAAAVAEIGVERRRERRRIGEGGKLSVDDLITLHNAGVSPKYIEQMRGAGLGDLSLDDLVALRIQGVGPEYIKEMAAAGYPNLTVQNLIGLRVQGVSPKYVQELAAAGYKNLSINDLVAMRIQGVDAKFVKSLADAGYTNLSARELIRLRVSGVDADFVRELAKYRTK